MYAVLQQGTPGWRSHLWASLTSSDQWVGAFFPILGRIVAMDSATPLQLHTWVSQCCRGHAGTASEPMPCICQDRPSDRTKKCASSMIHTHQVFLIYRTRLLLVALGLCFSERPNWGKSYLHSWGNETLTLAFFPPRDHVLTCCSFDDQSNF